MNEKWHSQEWSLECNDTPRAGSQPSTVFLMNHLFILLLTIIDCYCWLLNVSMIQLVILLIMISSGYYSTILLIIWQLHWLSTHPPSTPLHSSPLVQILKFLTIHWSLTEGVYPCFLFDSVVKNDYQEIVWHVVLC